MIDDTEVIWIESPIEQLFWDYAMVRVYGIVPQHKIENYRVDFAVPDKKVAIELDGHDYHKTKKQRTYDAERERNIELLGWKVIRFTGSEVYKDVDYCVEQVNKFIEMIDNG
jgi:very-short-patch-repair endonuclease